MAPLTRLARVSPFFFYEWSRTMSYTPHFSASLIVLDTYSTGDEDD
jgi:hypothetical protein